MKTQGAKIFETEDAGQEPPDLWGDLELAEDNGDITSTRYVDS